MNSVGQIPASTFCSGQFWTDLNMCTVYQPIQAEVDQPNEYKRELSRDRICSTAFVHRSQSNVCKEFSPTHTRGLQTQAVYPHRGVGTSRR